MNRLVACRDCNRGVSSSARRCPACNAKFPARGIVIFHATEFAKALLLFAALVILAGILLARCSVRY